VFGD